MSYRVLLVGLGAIAMGYDLDIDDPELVYTHARAFHLHPNFELAGGVDPDAGRRAAFEQRYGTRASADLAGAASEFAPDVVIIAVPTEQHSAVLQTVLQHCKPRLILCEKPLAYDRAEAQRMVETCREHGCLLYVNYLRRVDPGVREIKRRIVAGEIITPVKGVAWYTKGLLHSGSHFSNLLEFWLGPVAGFSIIRPGRLWQDADPEPDVQVQFVSGNVTLLAAREEHFSHYEIQLVAPNGCLRYEQGGGKIVWQAAAPDPAFAGYTVLSATGENIRSEGPKLLWHVADQVSACLSGQPVDLCSGADALKTLETLLNIKTETA